VKFSVLKQPDRSAVRPRETFERRAGHGADRRTPEAIDSSLVILKTPMSPVAACVPRSSFEKISCRPSAFNQSTHFSPYFSPNSAIAPERIASSIAISWFAPFRRM
jgi:hypothetical protein